MKREKSNIKWHPAFIQAIQMELDEYRDFLEYIPEFQLTAEPLRIDCVIIKKVKDIEIKKNIASIFKEVNLLEYKSPGDHVSVADFYKVYAYACLYASLNNTPITSMTISFVESRNPRELLYHFKKARAYKVEENNPGIYTVIGDILPIQLIDNRKLSAYENLWLKSLNNSLNPLDVLRISEKADRLDKTARINAYMDVIAKANYKAIEEVIKMNKPAKSLDEVLVRSGFVARVESRTRESTTIDIAKNLVKLGLPLETIITATKLESEKVKELYELSE